MDISYLVAEAIFKVFVVVVLMIPIAIIDTTIVYLLLCAWEWREKRREQQK